MADDIRHLLHMETIPYDRRLRVKPAMKQEAWEYTQGAKIVFLSTLAKNSAIFAP